jgi:hypothetical protein
MAEPTTSHPGLPLHRLAAAVGLIAGIVLGATPAAASLTIRVDKSAQRLTVLRDGDFLYDWPISTGREGLETPNGRYTPERLARKWRSREYDDAPMPYSIFFHGGYAIHGSYETSAIGEPVSHGCVRLSPRHAAVLFALVRHEGAGGTHILITGQTPQIYEVEAAPPDAGVPPESGVPFGPPVGETVGETVPLSPFQGLPAVPLRQRGPNFDYGRWYWQNLS